MKFLQRFKFNLLAVTVVFFVLLISSFPVIGEVNPDVLLIDVEGNQQIPDEKILGVISNTKVGQPLNPQLVQQDMQAIMALGFFADIQVKTDKFFDGIKLVFVVIENPRFQEVRIKGLTKFNPDELKPFFTQKPGEVFNVVTFRNDLSKALKYCQEEKGFFIEPKATNNFRITEDGIVEIELVELVIGKIKITGLEKTKEFVVLRELTLKEGDVIDYNQLREEYWNIMRLRLFETIDLKFEKSSIPNALDLVLSLKEARTGSGSLGISFAESTGEVGGLLGFKESNLMGLGQELSLDINLSENSKNIRFSFYEPWLDDNRTSFGLSMWNSDSSMTSTMKSWLNQDGMYEIDLTRTGLSLSFGRMFWKDTAARVRFRFEENIIHNYWLDGTDKPEHNKPEQIDFWNNSAGIEIDRNKLKREGRNFVVGGYQLTGSYTVFGEYLGGDYNYNELMLEGKWFHSLTPNLVIGTRLRGEYLTGDYPDYEELYLGGMYKLRGYDERRFDDENTRKLIGSSYLLSNTELRYRLPSNKNLEFVLFYDVGQINNSGDSLVRSDYGVGFRIDIPFFGLIRVDNAWNEDGDSRLVISMSEMF
ncbi:MAG TPA: BamA/TamA family outer membrane protein [Bacillota bacterium]|nr:BamA/TamA family outer membrane protein [Bacillota bacterium]HOL09423.1 BamA/TamA family outer membrane protein [Bacillota bacterium]HPO97147.1 BamA/TamA family outer membrane protein [Bacillota bacterium]